MAQTLGDYKLLPCNFSFVLYYVRSLYLPKKLASRFVCNDDYQNNRCVDMVKVFGLCSLVLLSLGAVGCATTSEEKNENFKEPGALDIILCEEPRPEICTREYDPVCAVLKDGSTRTGSTGCTSCSDSQVVGYTKGACGIVSID